MNKDQTLRVLDANLNRSREGLRVCEEISRFILNDASLTKRLKHARHAISGAIRRLPYAQVVSSRNVGGDVGKKAVKIENRRKDAIDLFIANAERAKESLRALEEFSKLIAGELPADFKKIRFEVYAIEKIAMRKLEALSHYGAKASWK